MIAFWEVNSIIQMLAIMIIIYKFFRSSKSQVLWVWKETISVTSQSQTILSEYNKSLAILQKSGSRKVSDLSFYLLNMYLLLKLNELYKFKEFNTMF